MSVDWKEIFARRYRQFTVGEMCDIMESLGVEVMNGMQVSSIRQFESDDHPWFGSDFYVKFNILVSAYIAKEKQNVNMTDTDIEHFLKWAENSLFVDFFKDSTWSYNGDEVVWEIEGTEYISETLGEPLRKDGFFIIDTNNGCGQTVSLIFKESLEE